MARSSRRIVTRRRTPNRGWTGQSSAAYVAVPAASKFLISVFVPSNPGIDETLLRTVGILSIASDQASGLETQVGALGMIGVSDAAVTIGITAIPDPISDIDNDGWMLIVPFSQQTTLGVDHGADTKEYHFDSKAKRVLPGQGVGFAVVIANAHATHALEFTLYQRVLAMVRGT